MPKEQTLGLEVAHHVFAKDATRCMVFFLGWVLAHGESDESISLHQMRPSSLQQDTSLFSPSTRSLLWSALIFLSHGLITTRDTKEGRFCLLP